MVLKSYGDFFSVVCMYNDFDKNRAYWLLCWSPIKKSRARNIAVTSAVWLFEESVGEVFDISYIYIHQRVMSTEKTSAAPEGKQPTTILCIGMAGSGKTTLMQVIACDLFFFLLLRFPLYAE